MHTGDFEGSFEPNYSMMNEIPVNEDHFGEIAVSFDAAQDFQPEASSITKKANDAFNVPEATNECYGIVAQSQESLHLAGMQSTCSVSMMIQDAPKAESLSSDDDVFTTSEETNATFSRGVTRHNPIQLPETPPLEHDVYTISNAIALPMGSDNMSEGHTESEETKDAFYISNDDTNMGYTTLMQFMKVDDTFTVPYKANQQFAASMNSPVYYSTHSVPQCISGIYDDFIVPAETNTSFAVATQGKHTSIGSLKDDFSIASNDAFGSPAASEAENVLMFDKSMKLPAVNIGTGPFVVPDDTNERFAAASQPSATIPNLCSSLLTTANGSPFIVPEDTNSCFSAFLGSSTTSVKNIAIPRFVDSSLTTTIEDLFKIPEKTNADLGSMFQSHMSMADTLDHTVLDPSSEECCFNIPTGTNRNFVASMQSFATDIQAQVHLMFPTINVNEDHVHAVESYPDIALKGSDKLNTEFTTLKAQGETHHDIFNWPSFTSATPAPSEVFSSKENLSLDKWDTRSSSSDIDTESILTPTPTESEDVADWLELY